MKRWAKKLYPRRVFNICNLTARTLLLLFLFFFCLSVIEKRKGEKKRDKKKGTMKTIHHER